MKRAVLKKGEDLCFIFCSLMSALPPVDVETSRLLVADPAGTPVPRRERPRRSSERQRGSASSTLAASVGLQCPGGGAEWRASERLSQVNLDAIVFPGVLQTAAGGEVTAAGPGEPPETDGNGPEWSRSTPSPPAPQRKPSSLRISESSFASCSDQQQLDADASQDDSDEVFVQNLPCPSPPQSPLQDTSSVEDFPPPPPDVDQAAEDQTGGRWVVSLAPSAKVRTTSCGCCLELTHFCSFLAGAHPSLPLLLPLLPPSTLLRGPVSPLT